MSAQGAVLSTPEILHLILAQLPQRLLLISAQRVCRRWRDAITASPTIQQKLFFRPMSVITAQHPKKQLNPILREAFPPWFEPEWFPEKHDAPLRRCQAFDNLPVDRNRDAFLRKGASWRRMLVQQPPVLNLGVIYASWHTNRAGAETILFKKRVSFEDDDGLRMDTLYDLVYDHLGFPSRWCQLAWWTLPAPDPDDLDNEESREAAERMLGDVDVVLQLQSFCIPMNPYKSDEEWKREFRSEDYDAVDVYTDESEEESE